MPEHILSLSYGKDSMACFGACEQLGRPIDRVVTAEVWATDTIPADLPPMVEFKSRADRIIKKRWGIEVEHIRHKMSYEEMFYRPICRGPNEGVTKGWPLTSNSRAWCKHLKVMNKLSPLGAISYVGIAADEPNRFHNLSDTKRSPLVEAGWTEDDCRRWCEDNDLLSPIYTTATRGGCWFCHNQGVNQLRLLRKNYPELWALMMKWDKDSPVTFKADGHTVHDFDRRFQMEDEGADLSRRQGFPLENAGGGAELQMVLTDEKRALLGDHEAAKRLTEAGVLLPCCCGREAHIKKRDKIISYKVCCESISCGNETMWWPDERTAIRVWNTRAPILSEEEMEILEGME